MSANTIYNHRHLQPANAPPASVSAPAVNASSRLAELLEIVKQEFDAVSTDGALIKGQRDEYELKLAAQISEINALRQNFFDLKTTHQDIIQRYEEEITRLRRELDARGSLPSHAAQQSPHPAPAPPAVATHLPPVGPILPGAPLVATGGAAPNVGRAPQGLFGGMMAPGSGGGASAASPTAGAERAGEGAYGGAYGNGAGAGGHPPPGPAPGEHPSKRMRADDGQAYGGHTKGSVPPTSTSTHPSPYGSHAQPKALPPSTSGSYGAGSPVASQAVPAGYMPNPPASLQQAQAQAPGSPTADGGANVFDFSDPDSLPREYKKEGSDWIAMFNPNSRRVLDVSLVHNLVHESVVCCVRFSQDGKFLATGCNRTAQIYDTKTGAKTCVLVDENVASKGDLYIRSVCFSHDGKYLATGAEDKQIRIWDIAKRRIRTLFTGHKQEIYSLDFSRDGRFVASGSGDKTARLWDLENNNCMFTFNIEDVIIGENGPIDSGVTSVAISPDGRLIAAGSLDTKVRVWDAKTGQQLERLMGHKDSVYSVAFSPDGKTLVSGSLDKTLRLWDLGGTVSALQGGNPPVVKNEQNGEKTGHATCLTTFVGHKDYVLSVAVSPDGAWIVSGSKDRGVQFWDPRTSQPQLMLQGHKNSVISIDLSPRGVLLATGSGDYHARVWSYTTE